MDQLRKQKLFTTPQVANILGVTRVTVFRWIKEGILKATKVGSHYLITHDELLKHTESLTDSKKTEIEMLVKKVISDYGETIRMLGRE